MHQRQYSVLENIDKIRIDLVGGIYQKLQKCRNVHLSKRLPAVIRATIKIYQESLLVFQKSRELNGTSRFPTIISFHPSSTFLRPEVDHLSAWRKEFNRSSSTRKAISLLRTILFHYIYGQRVYILIGHSNATCHISRFGHFLSQSKIAKW